MNNGWIKLHRKFLEWEWYSDSNCVRVFLHCLLKANHKDRKWQGKTIKRGQFLTGYDSMSFEINLSVQQIRTALGKLKKTGEITSQSTNKGTCITVCNYDIYQGEEFDEQQADNKRITNEQQTDNKRITTNKNDKNVNNDKNDKKRTATELLALSLSDYLIDAIIEYDSTHKYASNRPNTDSNGWMKEIDRAIRIDGRTAEQLTFIIDYVYRENGKHSAFWAGNIESGAKLRKHFDKIKQQIKAEHGTNDHYDFEKELAELNKLNTIYG